MKQAQTLENFVQSIDRNGILIDREKHGFKTLNTDYVFPYVVITLCLNGSGRALYDMQEMDQKKNDLAVILPGHILRPLDCTDDYTFASLAISAQIFGALKSHIFSHDYAKFNKTPLCHLTDEQVKRLMEISDLLEIISAHQETGLGHRHQLLLSQLAIGYEFINYYRREQDRQWSTDRHAALYAEFRDLVVTHYRESHEVKFYADMLHMQPKYFSRVIREASGGISPGQWIDQYLASRAKQMILTHHMNVKETAYMLGYTESSSFCRFFKRVMGITPKEFKIQNGKKQPYKLGE